MNNFEQPGNPERPKTTEPTDGPGPPDQTGESGDLKELILEMLETSGGPEAAEAEAEAFVPSEPAGEPTGEPAGGDLSAEPPSEDPENPKKRKKGKKEKKKSALRALVKFLIKLAVVALLFWLALTYVFGVFRLVGNGMYPMLKDGDLCITYRLDPYYSQDVVAYRVGEEIHFGRIVARAGDTVNGDSTGLVVNGGHPTEEIFYPTQMLNTDLDLPVTLDEGEFVILNDHREDLEDSRTYGVIREEDLEGKVVFLFRRRSI